MTQPTHDPSTRAAQQGELFTDRIENSESAKKGQQSAEAWPGERQAVHAIIAEFKKLLGPLQSVTAVRPGAPDSLAKLEAALARLPGGDAFGQMVDGLRRKAAEAVARARRERIQAFRRIETDFVRGVQAQGESVREQANGWRVGPLEFQVRREQAQCRWLYNREVLAEWSMVTSLNDVERTRAKSLELLRKAALPEASLREAFWEAYRECIRLQQGGKANPSLVPLLDFYRQLRLTLVSRDLAQRTDKKLSYAEFPKWAFLYNLDLYRTLSSSVPRETRLAFQTGSQQETRRLGVVTNGLDPGQDYKVVCYILQG